MGVTVREKVKGSGEFWVFICHQGKSKSHTVGDKREAEKVAEMIRARLVLGDLGIFQNDKPKVKTFKEYADLWIKTTVPATCKRSTTSDYKSILRLHVLPEFNDEPVDIIKRGDIKNFLLKKYNSGYARNTVCHMKDVLSGVLNKAIDDEIIIANPALNLGKIFKNEDKTKSIDPLTKDELQLLLKTTAIDFPNHHPLFMLLARTGLRIGEALALKWGDIDFNGRFINVKRSIVRSRKTTPKNGKARKVDMSLQLTETLKAYKKQSKTRGLKLGLGRLPEYIFFNKKGTWLDKDNWRNRVFNKALEKAEIRDIRVHDMRHTYATLRISKGDSIEDVSNQLGHHSPKLTWDTYYHWIPGEKKHEVDGLDDPSFTLLNAPYTHLQKKRV